MAVLFFNVNRKIMAVKTKAKSATDKKKKKDISESYNRYKLFKGQQYTGMKIGGRHKWNYDQGIWIDRKITPDKWLINYEVKKRRAGKAPEGSGAPVGTEYHWYIMAHQVVKKLDANTYSTEMNGIKYKLAHKRFDKEKWNASEKSQRKKLIKLLYEMITELENEPETEKNLVEENIKPLKTKVPAKKKTVKKKVAPRELQLEEA
jgi:hypothetical protein